MQLSPHSGHSVVQWLLVYSDTVQCEGHMTQCHMENSCILWNENKPFNDEIHHTVTGLLNRLHCLRWEQIDQADELWLNWTHWCSFWQWWRRHSNQGRRYHTVVRPCCACSSDTLRSVGGSRWTACWGPCCRGNCTAGTCCQAPWGCHRNRGRTCVRGPHSRTCSCSQWGLCFIFDISVYLDIFRKDIITLSPTLFQI